MPNEAIANENMILWLNARKMLLDVVSLFTSIPIQFACNVIREIYDLNLINLNLNVDNIIELINFCLSSNCFIFNNTYYKRIQGAAIGSPLSVRIAEIVMRFLENKINSHLDKQIPFLKR